MMSCITAFYCVLLPASAGAQGAPALRPAESPDALYAEREDLAKARRAALLWSSQASGGTDYEASWKFARACYYLGTMGPENARDSVLDSGIAAGEQAIKIAPRQPEGHFWYAATMGARAERGLFAQLRYGTRIREEFERSVAAKPGWQAGSAEAALGQWYFRAPGIAGGSTARAVEMLKQALTYGPDVSNTLYSLAEVYATSRSTWPDARALLQRVLAAPIDPDWAPEDKAIKVKAAALLKKIA
jgi:hypothetical protein